MIEFKKRKWGYYITLWSETNFKVKLLRFRKGGYISYQRHAKREELWCFLSGKGVMVVSKDKFKGERKPYKKGNHCLVPVGHWHQYTAEEPTLVLEIQRGEACLEEDIERV